MTREGRERGRGQKATERGASRGHGGRWAYIFQKGIGAGQMPQPPVKAVPWHEVICKVEREPENTEFYYKDIRVI